MVEHASSVQGIYDRNLSNNSRGQYAKRVVLKGIMNMEQVRLPCSQVGLQDTEQRHSAVQHAAVRSTPQIGDRYACPLEIILDLRVIASSTPTSNCHGMSGPNLTQRESSDCFLQPTVAQARDQVVYVHHHQISKDQLPRLKSRDHFSVQQYVPCRYQSLSLTVRRRSDGH